MDITLSAWNHKIQHSSTYSFRPSSDRGKNISLIPLDMSHTFLVTHFHLHIILGSDNMYRYFSTSFISKGWSPSKAGNLGKSLTVHRPAHWYIKFASFLWVQSSRLFSFSCMIFSPPTIYTIPLNIISTMNFINSYLLCMKSLKKVFNKMNPKVTL